MRPSLHLEFLAFGYVAQTPLDGLLVLGVLALVAILALMRGRRSLFTFTVIVALCRLPSS